MTYPLPWVPGPRRPGAPAPAGVVALLETWLASGLTEHATTTVSARCVRVWMNRHRWHAYDDHTGQVLATIPNPHNVRRFTGTEVPPCSCS